MRTLTSLAPAGRRALVRVDFNVPLDADGAIIDDARIRAALPTLRHLVAQGCPCVVASHLGRPGGKPDDGLRMAPVCERLKELMSDVAVEACDDIAGDEARARASALAPGAILVLQNLRFEPGEEKNDDGFAAELSRLGEIYVNDAFAVCHREHASVDALPRRFVAENRAAGLLVEREVEAIDDALHAPRRPLVAIFGGAKVSGKLAAMRTALDRVDRILVGGAAACTLLKAGGEEVGTSMVEDDCLDEARRLLETGGERLRLPRDHAVPAARDDVRTVERIPRDAPALDIGPATITAYRQIINDAGTVIWNGPLGYVEDARFIGGTRGIAEALKCSDATCVAGGGHTGDILRRLGLAEAMTHVSTGGGAFLHYVAHRDLPALRVLQKT
ncbi:MAG: phosphoglycerate kinase [Halofilum sp. (in: g-proteobacteria)]